MTYTRLGEEEARCRTAGVISIDALFLQKQALLLSTGVWGQQGHTLRGFKDVNINQELQNLCCPGALGYSLEWIEGNPHLPR